MLKLIINEYIKMLKRKSTIIATIIVILACVGMQLILKNVFNSDLLVYSDSEYTETVEEYEEDVLSQEEEGYISDYQAKMEKKFIAALKEVGVEKMDEFGVEELRSIIFDGMFNGNIINDEDTDKLIELFKHSREDFTFYLEMMAKEQELKYTKEVLDDAITNPYEYLLEKGVTRMDDERIQQVLKVVEMQGIIEDADAESEDVLTVVKEYKTAKYALDHNKSYYINDNTSLGMYGDYSKEDVLWLVLLNSSSVFTILSICMLVLAGQIVAKEFTEGTIKFLLINPVKRGKIIVSKYLTLISMSLILMLLSFVVNILFAVIFNGAHNLGCSYISYSLRTGKVVEYAALLYYAKTYLLAFVQVIVYETMAFALSSVLRSTAAAVGTGIACMLGGSIVSSILLELQIDWGRYLIFTNINLKSVMDGTTGYVGLTMPFALVVIAVHMVVFFLSAYDGFVRREV